MRVHRVGAHFLYFLSMAFGQPCFPPLDSVLVETLPVSALGGSRRRRVGCFVLFGLSSKALMCKDRECEAFPSRAPTVGPHGYCFIINLLLWWVDHVESCRVLLIWGLGFTKIQPLSSELPLSSENGKVGPLNSWSFRTEFRQAGGLAAASGRGGRADPERGCRSVLSRSCSGLSVGRAPQHGDR